MELVSKGSKKHHSFKLVVNEDYVSDGGENYSRLSFSFLISAVQNGWDWASHGSNISYIVTINGNNFSGKIPSYDGKSIVTLKSGTIDVPHESDGSKKIGISFSVSDTSGANYTCGNASSNGEMQLTSIARQANLTGADNFNDEANPSIYYSNPAGNSVTSLMACISLTGSTDDIVYRDVPKTGSSYQFVLTDTERNVLRNAMTTNSLMVIFYLRTIIGNNTFYSTMEKTVTLVNGNPTFTNFTYKDTNESVTSVTGDNQVLIKGLSNLKVEISATNKMIANKNTTAKNYITTIDKVNVSTNYSDSDLLIDLGNLSVSGNQRLTVRAYDNRNNSTPVNKDIYIIDYDKPIINATALRLNNFENTTTLSVSGTYSKLVINEVSKNTITSSKYRYRETNGEWTEWNNLTFTIQDNKFTCEDVILNLDNSKSFEFEIKVNDNLINVFVSVGEAIFFISTNKKTCFINGQEILKYLNENNDEFITFVNQNGKKFYPNAYYPINSIFSSSNYENPSNILGNVWELYTSQVINDKTIYYWKRIS